VSFFHLLNTKEDILKNDGNQTVAVTDCHSMEKNGYHQMFVHNIFFCVQQMRETHTGLEQLEGE